MPPLFVCALQDGVRETGVSVAYTVLACDAGPVLAQQRVSWGTAGCRAGRHTCRCRHAGRLWHWISAPLHEVKLYKRRSTA